MDLDGTRSVLSAKECNIHLEQSSIEVILFVFRLTLVILIGDFELLECGLVVAWCSNQVVSFEGQPPHPQLGVVGARDQVGVLLDESKVPDFAQVASQGLEAVLDTQVPELDKSVFAGRNDHVFPVHTQKKHILDLGVFFGRQLKKLDQNQAKKTQAPEKLKPKS